MKQITAVSFPARKCCVVCVEMDGLRLVFKVCIDISLFMFYISKSNGAVACCSLQINRQFSTQLLFFTKVKEIKLVNDALCFGNKYLF